MSLTTHFQHEQVTHLPLPPLRTNDSYNSVIERGVRVARALCRDHGYMMHLNPFVTGHDAIPASADQAVDIPRLAAEFNVVLSSVSATAVVGDDGDRDKDGNGGGGGDKHTHEVNGGDEWKHYDIYDVVPVALGYKKDVTYHCAMRDTAEGMESLTNPGSGVTLHAKWSVVPSRDDPTVLLLTERNTVHCSLLLGWFIKSSMASSHAELHRAFKAGFVEEMRK